MKNVRIIKNLDTILYSLATIIALIGLLGWASGELSFAKFFPIYIPIAPATSISFIFLSLSSILLKKMAKQAIILVQNISSIFFLLFIYVVLAWALNLPWDIESIFVSAPDSFGEVKTGRMSPFTAILFVIEYFTLILLYSTKKKTTNSIIWISIITSLYASTILLIGYLYNEPLLYGGTIIPVALPTAICFWLIGISQLYFVSTKTISFPFFTLTPTTKKLISAFLPVVIAVVFIEGFIRAKNFHLFNQALDSALTLLILIPITFYIIYLISKSLGNSLEKANNSLKIAKKKAEDSEARFKELFSNVNDAIFIYDPDNLKIIDANKATSDIYGYSYDELIGMSALKFSAEVEESKKVAKSIKTKEKININFRHHKKKDGTDVFVDLSTYNVIINGENTFYSVCHDITDIKQSEDELIEAKEKAEEADRLKSAFLANMSHEIRTPMNGILGFTKLLQESDISVEHQKNYINIIENSGNRLLDTVNDIIEISKIDTGQITVSSTKVNIGKKLKSMFDFFSLEAEKKGLNLILENELSEDESLILSDKNKLNSILTNLVKNAIKFTNKGTIKIGCKKNKDFLELYVEDTGIGIPANRKEAIFNRFEQADIEDKEVHEGSGLGLAITKSYVEMLGGEIWVESEENKGSTFFVTIPYNPANAEINPISAGKKQEVDKTKKLNVLIVEDDNISSYYLSTILKDKAENIQIAKDGLEAVEICKKNSNFDIILMDIKMPGIDGLEATERIRKFNKDVKIIAQTAHALGGDKEKAIEAGCNGYISKPINREKLIEVINKHI